MIEHVTARERRCWDCWLRAGGTKVVPLVNRLLADIPGRPQAGSFPFGPENRTPGRRNAKRRAPDAD
jgi:hypothetical protein